ncbi:prostatic spermine-binding protein [Capsicum chacoense]
MEVNSFSYDVEAFGKIVMNSVLEAVVAESLLVAQRSVTCLLMVRWWYGLRTFQPPQSPLGGIHWVYCCCTLSVVFYMSSLNMFLFFKTGCLLKDGAPLLEFITPDRRFPFEALNQKNETCPENKDGSDTENDDEDEDGDAEDQDDDDDDANDEDFSGEEGGDDDDDDEGPEEDPAANGNEGSDDDDDDEDGDDDEGDDDEEEEEGEDEDEEEDQPPAKKRK